MNTRMVVMVIGVLVVLCVRLAGAAVLTEDFDDNVLNANLWTPTTYGDLTQLEERNQRLEIVFPREELDFHLLSGQYRSKFLLRGDYDIQLDFVLLNGTQFSNGGVWMEAFDGIGCGNCELYGTGYSFGNWRATTTDSAGKLRLVRVNRTTTGYYCRGAEWISLGSQPTVTGDVTVRFGYSNRDSLLVGSPLSIALDNFVVNEGEIVWPVPEPSNILALICGLGGLVATVSRKRIF